MVSVFYCLVKTDIKTAECWNFVSGHVGVFCVLEVFPVLNGIRLPRTHSTTSHILPHRKFCSHSCNINASKRKSIVL